MFDSDIEPGDSQWKEEMTVFALAVRSFSHSHRYLSLLWHDNFFVVAVFQSNIKMLIITKGGLNHALYCDMKFFWAVLCPAAVKDDKMDDVRTSSL